MLHTLGAQVFICLNPEPLTARDCLGVFFKIGNLTRHMVLGSARILIRAARPP